MILLIELLSCRIAKIVVTLQSINIKAEVIR